MRHLIVAGFVACVALAGCAQIGQFTAGDAQNAAAIDPSGAACYSAVGALGTAAVANTKDTGVLTIIATKRAVQGVLANPACAPIEAAVLAELLKATPAGAFIP